MKKIDYGALVKNAQFFKKLIDKSQLCAVLKNDAYGHGLKETASRICPYADFFAVGSVEEAEQILYLKKDILLLLPQNGYETARAVADDLILTVDSFETLKRVDGVAKNLRKKARIHLKINSGMSRLGFEPHQIDDLLAMLGVSFVAVEGVFSHFYGVTQDTCDKQLEVFKQCADKIKRRFPDAIFHIANTSAALLSTKYHLDAVRIGLGLYGYGSELLTPAKKVYANVIATRYAPAGCVAGYGPSFKCEHATNLAVLDIGYAKGLSRALVGSKVKINSQFYPIVAICMAMTIVDTFSTAVNVGDVACLLGDGVNLSNNNVIVYELLCNLQ